MSSRTDLARTHSPSPGAPLTSIIGHSVRGAPLVVQWLGDVSATPRVLLVAGQHGDEREGSAAVRRLLETSGGSTWGVRLAVLAEANPDGAADLERRNAMGIDLNRDHALLRAPESRALHGLIREFRPHVVVDVHNYPSRRAHLLERGWILDDDVLLATPTHPAIRSNLSAEVRMGLEPTVLGALRAAGLPANEYRLIQPSGRVRRSTLHVEDLRNGVGLRHGAFTVLVEGRSPRLEEDAAAREHLVEAQRSAIAAVLDWAALHRDAFGREPDVRPEPGDRVALGARWTAARHGALATVRDVSTGVRTSVRFPEFEGDVEVTRTGRLPWGYAVPRDAGRLVAWLDRQGFGWFVPAPGTRWDVEESVCWTGPEEPRGTNLGGPARTTVATARRGLDDHRIYPVSQPGGQALAVWLEAGSEFGHAGDADVGLAVSPGRPYPVRRVLSPA